MNQQLVESLAQIVDSLSIDDRELLGTKIRRVNINEQTLQHTSQRIPGQDKGLVIIHDGFEDPLPSDLLNSFFHPADPC